MGPVTNDGTRHRAEAGVLVVGGGPVTELVRHLVKEWADARSRAVHATIARTHDDVVVQAEAEQHGLLQPLMSRPDTVPAASGDAGLAGIQQGQGLFDGLAHLALGRRRDVGARLPGGFDHGFELSQIGHEGSPSRMAVVRKGLRAAAR